jgi:hypothetical protein
VSWKKGKPEGISAVIFMLKAPETILDVGLILVAAPAVVQPEGQSNPGEWYRMISSATGFPASWADATEVITGPGGSQSNGRWFLQSIDQSI